MIESPCNRTCTIDESTGWCIGCGRTIEEIIEWGPASDAQKREIVAGLEERMKRMGQWHG
ncbi:DUF1289 domain-containing protein [Rhizorhapis sp. SPR117]|uniref:DUF1289 domain-containing protein n=1 Tax=Rhizorhapis sp. SPR117 TaxID=2912611 RepID=UPI001F19EC82|nr:DUF1289 domain-containing protein [Rhizorhapis sp. SPR117]